ncbi:FMO-like domain-containing protein [Cephalotus follicularis]|uniref:Flavin-containing monooxygenase n=1 Tax=Cephalotus follicularis TaxID=3775 RepID=A0A1Q3C0Y1_CEPFO|nr:FMO-like domain-containing protein [Cephalotus follicularis]
MEKQVAIIGAGLSGLLACKYIIEKGFNPIVFEAEECIGGVWSHTMESTRLQNMRFTYQFSDFPWPPSIKDLYPTHTQVMEYFKSYAQNFGLYRHIKFNSKVIGIDYVGETEEEMQSWDLWGGTSKPFGSKGKWHIRVQDTRSCNIEVYQVEFIILCIGQFSGLPNIPEFPPNEGPEVFSGKVMHAIDYSAMDKSSTEDLIRNKRITIIGSNKSAVDIASECARANGAKCPCTMIQRSVRWFLPCDIQSGFIIGFLYFNRFAEMLVHKPGESFPLSFLATLLAPLRWGTSKLVESYLRWKLPLKKYGMIPKCSFFQNLSSCQIAMLPDKFYDQVEEGSIILKKSQSFSFCKEGLIINGEAQPLEADTVIFATGYKGDEKLKNIFQSPFFQRCIMGSPSTAVPLYRQILHPRIPQLAIIGYSENLSALCTFEVRCQWLAQFLDGEFELPNIKYMEKEVTIWGNHFKRYTGKYFRRSCVGNIHIWHNDILCKDMGCNPRRKKGFLAELFEPYSPTDYADLSGK